MKRISGVINVGYGKQRKSTIPEFDVYVRPDMPLSRQSNEEYKPREVLPNYINKNPNDKG